MIIRNSQPPQPILAISPASLDFGLVNYAEEAAEGHGIARLTIRNDGDRMLVGRIAIQVSWVTAYPPDFRLNPGESSDHLFTVRRVNQLTWNSGHKLGSDFIALINSNGGSETIGGYYYIDNAETVKKRAPLSPRIFAFLALGLLLTAAVLYFVFWQDRKITETRTTEQVSAFYTQIAETIHADIAAQLPTATRTIVVPAAALATPARPGASDSAAPVFTPWIPGDYPNPEDFVRSYYATIAEGRLSDAWWMMSEKSQIACCYNKGGQPRRLLRGELGRDQRADRQLRLSSDRKSKSRRSQRRNHVQERRRNLRPERFTNRRHRLVAAGNAAHRFNQVTITGRDARLMIKSKRTSWKF